MSDPAVEAAQRAWADEGWGPEPLSFSEGSLAISAAREALKPIRTWFEWWAQPSTTPTEQAWGELARLLYSPEELER